MNTMADGARERCVAQIGEVLFGQPGLTLMELAEKVKALQPSKDGHGDALPPIREDQPLRGDEPIGEQHDARIFNRGWNACREAAAALAARQPVGQEPIELSGIAHALSEGGGFWRTCSGCHESNDGVPTGPYSRAMKCHLGTGCSECGGVGAIWDDTDYQAWSDQMVQSLDGPPAQAVDLGALPDGWRLSKKATCYQLSHGNDIVGNLVGPDAEENAAIIARVLDSKAVRNGR